MTNAGTGSARYSPCIQLTTNFVTFQAEEEEEEEEKRSQQITQQRAQE